MSSYVFGDDEGATVMLALFSARVSLALEEINVYDVKILSNTAWAVTAATCNTTFVVERDKDENSVLREALSQLESVLCDRIAAMAAGARAGNEGRVIGNGNDAEEAVDVDDVRAREKV